MTEQKTRGTLIERVREQHDEKSWEEFVSYYSRYIYVVIRNMNVSHHDTEDLVQQSLLKVWKGLPSFDYDPSKSRFRSWLCTVVKNTVRSFLRARSRRLPDLKEDERAAEKTYIENVTLPEIERIAEEEWETYIANLAFEGLRKRFEPQVIRAFELFSEGKSAQVVADELGVPTNTAHVYKQRVKNALFKEILRLDSELT